MEESPKLIETSLIIIITITITLKKIIITITFATLISLIIDDHK